MSDNLNILPAKSYGLRTTRIDRSGAIFSPSQNYRYRLWRRWSDGHTLAWCMLNPSTADASQNDPTIERCVRRAKQLGYGAIEVVNLFAYRSTNPSALYTVTDPVGPDNDAHITEVASKALNFVCE